MSASESPVPPAHAAFAALLDAVVPRDAHPSAVDAGGLVFLGRALAGRPDLAERAERVRERVAARARARHGREFATLTDEERAALLDGFASDPDHDWFTRLVATGYYADEGNGGNAGGASWRMTGWRPGPPAAPPAPEPREAALTPDALAARYDVVVVGSGAGGGAAAHVLAASGRSVLVVEAGTWPGTAELSHDHLRNPRASWGFPSLAGPHPDGNPRLLDDGTRLLPLSPTDPRWSNNAMTVGGGTRVYGAQAWRFGPVDFRMATHYGVPEGSALADWPFGYEELAPFYERAEWEIGVSGGTAQGPYGGPRARPLPMPPLPTGPAHEVLRAGAARLGLTTVTVPLLVNSVPYGGRPACAQCSQCVGFACGVDAKNGSLNTLLARAFATGRCRLLPEATAERLLVGRDGRVEGVALAGLRDGAVWRAEVGAGEVVLAGGAVESARLLLNSAHDGEPRGVGNGADQVGRHLQGHLYASAVGVFGDRVEDLVGPGPSLATTDFRQDNPGIVGGGIVAREFVPTPAATYHYLVDAGLIPAHGVGSKRGMRELAPRMLRLAAPIQEVTTAGARVRVDRGTRDRLGIPVAVLAGRPHPEDLRGQAFLAERCVEWLAAAGARQAVPAALSGGAAGPSGGQHQAGTCRMGTDPARSVTDPYGRVWGHGNLRVVDGSTHVTNGGVNPVLTIFANALRIASHMAAG
ncbi:GMC oxidoreductase [Streptomyces avicenniae]|uniref:GMC oxidoreductase n=1 Tax=Streptomyces avicenniae TaxID=500153 RepID=UPI001CBA60BD|nr:GMC oxidoreductase [Streptomyces avicenniae]